MLGLQGAVAGQQGFFKLRDVSQPGDWERVKNGCRRSVCVCAVCVRMHVQIPSIFKKGGELPWWCSR